MALDTLRQQMQTNGYSCHAAKSGRYICPSAFAHTATRTLTSPFPEQERNFENLRSKLRQNVGISVHQLFKGFVS